MKIAVFIPYPNHATRLSCVLNRSKAAWGNSGLNTMLAITGTKHIPLVKKGMHSLKVIR
jgi:hypothetical protein